MLKRLYHGVVILFFFAIMLRCNNGGADFHFANQGAIQFIKDTAGWKLLRNGKPFFIQGGHGNTNLPLLKKIGGNSVLLYHSELNDSILHVIDSLGLTLTITLDIGKVRFKENDYTDSSFINKQRNDILAIVKKYHKHPSLLFWIIGNEVHITHRNNRHVWNEINELSKKIHAIDSVHPTTSVLASYPTNTYEPAQVKVFAPDLDFITLTIHDSGWRLNRELSNFIWGTEKPVLISEWGGKPYWACEKTEWGAFIEPSTTQNANYLIHNHHTIFNFNKDKCIGGYVFYWGQKQERTHTAFSLILNEKNKTQAIENIQYAWTGTMPENKCPRIDSFFIEGKKIASCYLIPNNKATVRLKVHDNESDTLYLWWEVRPEGRYKGKTGGEKEDDTHIISSANSLKKYTDSIHFVTPPNEGAYRIFMYIYDTHDNVATANIPFYVLKHI